MPGFPDAVVDRFGNGSAGLGQLLKESSVARDPVARLDHLTQISEAIKPLEPIMTYHPPQNALQAMIAEGLAFLNNITAPSQGQQKRLR
jgi:hypothetical protein